MTRSHPSRSLIKAHQIALSHLSLNALRAFEVTARLQSFNAAADELSVTHGAVSWHIRLLGDSLGLPLLHRSSHGTEPTEEDRLLAEGLSRAVDLTQSSIQQVRSGPVH